AGAACDSGRTLGPPPQVASSAAEIPVPRRASAPAAERRTDPDPLPSPSGRCIGRESYPCSRRESTRSAARFRSGRAACDASPMPPSPLPETLAELAAGRMIVLVDAPSRENEGDLAMLAEHVTAEAINFMAREARGLVCMPLAGEICDRLGLRPQVE